MTNYIQHKLTRKQRIYNALFRQKARTVKSGSGKDSLTTKELVHLIYNNVPEDIFEMTLKPFTMEVLLKLAEDSKVRFGLNAGKKKWFLNK